MGIFNQTFKKISIVLFVMSPLLISSCSNRGLSLNQQTVNSEESLPSSQNTNKQIVVRFKSVMANDSFISFSRQYNARLIKTAAEINSAVLEFDNNVDISSILPLINSHPMVDYAEPNYQLSM